MTDQTKTPTTETGEAIPDFLKAKPEDRAKPASPRVQENIAGSAVISETNKEKIAAVAKKMKAEGRFTGKRKDGTPASEPKKTASADTTKPVGESKKAKAPKAATKKEAAPELTEEQKTGTPRRSIVPGRFKAEYSQHNDTCGDRVALALKAYTTTVNADGRPSLDLKKLEEVAKANGLEEDWQRYLPLNNGQKRMNISNKLRGLIKNDETVVIGSRRFAKAGLIKEGKPQPIAA
jgi:hypothetical protein